MITIKTILAAAGLGLICAGNAFAVSNGSFNDGLNGWSVLGDVAVANSVARLTNASLFEDDFPAPAAAYNVSGNAAADNFAGDVDVFAGLSNGALGFDAFEGSVLKQTFSVNAGDTLSFNWNFLTNEGANADYAFITINGVASTLATTANASNALQPGSLAWETGNSVFSQTFASAATVTLAVGVVDIGDYNVTSELRIDSVSVTPVPEPETYAMMVAGLLLIGGIARRRKVALQQS